jgi:hypothetical protein
MQDYFMRLTGQIAPGTLLYDGRFRVDMLLDSAYTRAIYRAWDLTRGRAVTLLEITTPDASRLPDALTRATPLVQLTHSLLSPIEVVFVQHDQFFIVIGLAGGQTIERIMAERTASITPSASVRWISQAAEGLEFLLEEIPEWHLGDTSSSALFVAADDRVQLLGFEHVVGLLTPQEIADLLPTGAVAPEMSDGICDARTDVYGLAASMYLLMSRQVWRGPSTPSLQSICPDLTPVLAEAIMRGLATDPVDRWSDAIVFYQALLHGLAAGCVDWWSSSDERLVGLAEEPPTLTFSRDELLSAINDEQAPVAPDPEPTDVVEEIEQSAAISEVEEEENESGSTLPLADIVFLLPPASDIAGEDMADVTAPLVIADVELAMPEQVEALPDIMASEVTCNAMAVENATILEGSDVHYITEPVGDTIVRGGPIMDEIHLAAAVVSCDIDREIDGNISNSSTPAVADVAETASEQWIVAHPDRQVEQAATEQEAIRSETKHVTSTPTRPRERINLLDRLRAALQPGAAQIAPATGTVVLPRHMYPRHTYSILLRVQCQPLQNVTDVPSQIVVDVEASSDAFYLPVRRLALRLPVEGGLSEGIITITALRASVPNTTDRLQFTFFDSSDSVLHEDPFIADIAILAPQQLVSGNPMVTLVHRLQVLPTN